MAPRSSCPGEDSDSSPGLSKPPAHGKINCIENGFSTPGRLLGLVPSRRSPGLLLESTGGSLLASVEVRWPGRIPAGRVSNEIVHEVDTYTTFARIAGAQVPQDRPIDGMDQTDFLLGKSDKSNREGFPVFVADRLEAVKWRNWKVVFYDEQRDWWTPPLKLGEPKVFDLITDPKEEYPATGMRNTWSATPALKIVVEFEKSLKQYPPIPPGTPDPYSPPKSGR